MKCSIPAFEYDRTVRWFPMRITLGKYRSIIEALTKAGVQYFYPSDNKKAPDACGRQQKESGVSNLVFLHPDKCSIQKLKEENRELVNLIFMGYVPYDSLRNGMSRSELMSKRRIIYVDDKSMEQFVRICSVTANDNCEFLDFDKAKAFTGKRCRITDGNLKGFEGWLRRKGHTRSIYFDISNVMSIRIKAIPMAWIQVIDPDPQTPGSSNADANT